MSYSYTGANLRLSTATSFREFFMLELWCEITSRFSEILVVTEWEVSAEYIIHKALFQVLDQPKLLSQAEVAHAAF